MMAETVDVPVIGPVKRQWLWVGGALVLGIVGYAYWARSQGGQGGGVEEVELQPEPGPGGVAPAPTPGGTVDETGGAILTNVQWSARVVEVLQQVGYEPGHIADALGAYLAKLPLTPDQEDVIRAAHALVGRPPEGNFPITAAPEPTPEEPAKPTAPSPVTSLTGRAITKNIIQLSWAPVSSATGFEVQRRAGGGLPASGIIKWAGTSYTNTRHLKPNTSYTFQVRATNSAGKSAWKTISVRTEK